MPASSFALAAEAALRVASLNLCTDEMLLLLADPRSVVSVSHLSRDPRESVLWRSARRFPGNDGSLESVARWRPDLILTMGGGGRARAAIAARLGIRTLDLPYPRTPEEVVRQAGQIARAIGRPAAVTPYEVALQRLIRPLPMREGALITDGGRSVSPVSLSGRWLALAGFRQPRLPGDRLTLETLVMAPPRYLIRSDYRIGQQSRGQGWFAHPIVRAAGSRTIRTDGRRWTCGGLPMIAEVARLRNVGR